MSTDRSNCCEFLSLVVRVFSGGAPCVMRHYHNRQIHRMTTGDLPSVLGAGTLGLPAMVGRWIGLGASIWKQTWLILAAATRTITSDHG